MKIERADATIFRETARWRWKKGADSPVLGGRDVLPPEERDAVETAASERWPAEKAKSAQRERSWRLPTPIIITLIGIVLSAWLLPAITRQWDDRQKAHRVKTALVTEMAEANARAFTGARRLLFVPRFDFAAGDFAPPPRPLEQWSKDSVRIEAELRASFTPRDVRLWRDYSTLVDTLIATAAGISTANSGIGGTMLSDQLLHGAAFPKSDLVGFKKAFDAINAWSADRRRVPLKIARLRKGLDADTAPAAWQLLVDYARFVRTVAGIEQDIATRVMTAHIRGYSTTWDDFFHDLIP